MTRDILDFWGDLFAFIIVSCVVVAVVMLLIWSITCLLGSSGRAELEAWCSSIEGTAYANGHCFKDGVELTNGGNI